MPNFEDLIDEIAEHFWTAAISYCQGMEFGPTPSEDQNYEGTLKKYKKMKGFK